MQENVNIDVDLTAYVYNYIFWAEYCWWVLVEPNLGVKRPPPPPPQHHFRLFYVASATLFPPVYLTTALSPMLWY